MRSRLYAIVAVLLLLSLLAACSPAAPTVAPTKPAAPAAPTTAAGQPAATAAPAAPAAAPTATPKPAVKIKRGGIAVIGRNKNIESFDNVIQLAFDAPGAPLIYEHLLNYKLMDEKAGKFELKPQLAESWDQSDPKKITLKLRKNIKFSDGSDFNAEVAKWNLDRMRTETKSVAKDKVDAIASVDIIDPYTIQINLSRASATALLKLSNALSSTAGYASTMASKANFDKVGVEGVRTQPVGTGPMVLSQYLSGDKFSLKKRDGYWQMGEDGQPLPYLDGYTERFIVDEAVNFVEIRTGGIHMSSLIGLKDIATVKNNPDLIYYNQPYIGNEHFVYGISDSPTSRLKDNLKLRQAIHYGIDRQSMAQTMGFGLAPASEYFLWLPTELGYDPSVIKYSFDANKSKQLLTEAGFPNGFDMTLTTIARDPDRKIAEIAQSMWNAVGIRTKIDQVERAAALDIWKGGRFDVGFQSVVHLADPDLTHTKNTVCTGPNNLTNICDKEFDECIIEGGSVLDTAKRAEIYKRCLKISQEHAWKQSAYQPPIFQVISKKLKGIDWHWSDPDLRAAWLDQ